MAVPGALALTLVVAATALACAAPRVPKAWTVLVYMEASASNLAAPSARNLRSIEEPAGVPSWSAASTAQADVVVELHRRTPRETRRFHLIQATAPGAAADVQSPLVEALDEEGVSPEESLRRFVSWGVLRYPSEHRAVIVWGHGRGPGGIEAGEGRGALGVPGLARALASVSRRRLHGRAFNLYASDACLMQSLEVAGALSAVARYVVGSESIQEDYVGLPYRGWLPVLNGSAPLPVTRSCLRDDAACNAAAALVGAGRSGARSTLSALDEEALAGALVPAMGRLSAAIDAYLREDNLRRIGLRALLGADRGALGGTPELGLGTRDVGVFLERLAAQVTREPGARGSLGQRGVLEAVKAARAALGRAVVAVELGWRDASPGMAGVSLWLPRDGEEYRAHRGRDGGPSFAGFLERVFAPPD